MRKVLIILLTKHRQQYGTGRSNERNTGVRPGLSRMKTVEDHHTSQCGVQKQQRLSVSPGRAYFIIPSKKRSGTVVELLMHNEPPLGSLTSISISS
jgi:hypothetical protein